MGLYYQNFYKDIIMKNNSTPAIWLIVLIAGIGMISETVYSPAIPSIADFLEVKQSWIEYTLTIYLFSFGIGTFFWGRISDHYGRATFKFEVQRELNFY